MNKLVLGNLTADKHASVLAAIGLLAAYEESGAQSSGRAQISWTNDTPSGIHAVALHGPLDSYDALGQFLASFVQRSPTIVSIQTTIADLASWTSTPPEDWCSTHARKTPARVKAALKHKKHLSRAKWNSARQRISSKFGSSAGRAFEGIWSDAVKDESTDAVSVSPLNVANARSAVIEGQLRAARKSDARALTQHLQRMSPQQLVDELIQPFAVATEGPRSLRYDDYQNNGIDYKRFGKKDAEVARVFPLINLLALLGDSQLVNYPGRDGNTCAGASDGTFTYPIWSDPRSLREIVCLMRRELPRTERARRSLGYEAVYRTYRSVADKVSYYSRAERVG